MGRLDRASDLLRKKALKRVSEKLGEGFHEQKLGLWKYSLPKAANEEPAEAEDAEGPVEFHLACGAVRTSEGRRH